VWNSIIIYSVSLSVAFLSNAQKVGRLWGHDKCRGNTEGEFLFLLYILIYANTKFRNDYRYTKNFFPKNCRERHAKCIRFEFKHSQSKYVFNEKKEFRKQNMFLFSIYECTLLTTDGHWNMRFWNWKSCVCTSVAYEKRGLRVSQSTGIWPSTYRKTLLFPFVELPRQILYYEHILQHEGNVQMWQMTWDVQKISIFSCFFFKFRLIRFKGRTIQTDFHYFILSKPLQDSSG